MGGLAMMMRRRSRMLAVLAGMSLFAAGEARAGLAYAADIEESRSRNKSSEEEFLEMAGQYGDKLERGNSGRLESVTAYDGSRDVFEYGKVSGKVERIRSYDPAGKLIETTVFYRDSATGQLLGYEKTDETGFFSLLDRDNDLFLKGRSDRYDVYNTFFSSLVITTESDALDFNYDEEGRLVVRDGDGKTTVYDKSGKVVSDGDVTYFYGDDGALLSSEERKGDELVSRTVYGEAGERSMSEYYERGLLSRRVFRHASGDVEERFEARRPYARITYFDDNKRVREIEYLDVGDAGFEGGE